MRIFWPPTFLLTFFFFFLPAYRKPFIPPTSAAPLIVRSLDYQGEPHLATIKRVVVVAVDHLPLRTPQAIHKFKLLAGPRWTPNPPTDAGVAKGEPWGNGYIKISCEDLPRPEMNLKWASDTLDKLVAEANVNISFIKSLKSDGCSRILKLPSKLSRLTCDMYTLRHVKRKREITYVAVFLTVQRLKTFLRSGYQVEISMIRNGISFFA